MNSLKGQLLLDGGKLRGSFFHRAVLLICQHDKEGAMGLILNRATENRVGEMILTDLPESLQDHLLYLGGPVQPTALSFLHSSASLFQGNVLSNLQLDHSLETLSSLGESVSPGQQVRIFAGYAGWAPGQLEDEMQHQAWLTHPASLDWIFYASPDELWCKILAGMGWQYRLLAEAPEDPSLN